MKQPQNVIDTSALSKSYNGLQALKPLDLQVPKNSIFGFLGPNGAGKTTMMKLLVGLTKPTGGTANVLGMDIVRDSIEIRRRVGYLAQHPQFYDYMTPRETLRFTARFFYSGPKDRLEAHIDETLELVGLEDLADRPTRGFSGGERQRLGIAQAQINNPELLILDEPAAALDPMGRHDVLEVMKRLQAQTTIFYSTHILDDVQRVSDTVAILNRGALVARAPIEHLLGGHDETIYSLTIRGRTADLYDVIASQPWVSSVTMSPDGDGLSRWDVSINDEDAAEDRLLRLVLDEEELRVIEFGRKTYELEEVFMNIVQGDNHAAQRTPTG
jgi:ABC-2 type transport system ATP-binding protein